MQILKLFSIRTFSIRQNGTVYGVGLVGYSQDAGEFSKIRKYFLNKRVQNALFQPIYRKIFKPSIKMQLKIEISTIFS